MSLLDNATPPVEGAETPPTEVTPPVEGTEAPPTEATPPVEGEVSFEYAGKFNSAGDLEKSYLELEKTFHQKLGAFTGAPEAYEVNVEGVDKDDPMLSLVTEWGKEQNLSNDGLNKLIEKYVGMGDQSNEDYVKGEMEKLGDNANQRLTTLGANLEKLVGKDGYEALSQTVTSADAVAALEKLIESTKPPTPTAIDSHSLAADSERLKQMQFATNDRGERLMEIDPAYAKKVRELSAKVNGDN